jgi:hypothetical protein
MGTVYIVCRANKLISELNNTMINEQDTVLNDMVVSGCFFFISNPCRSLVTLTAKYQSHQFCLETMPYWFLSSVFLSSDKDLFFRLLSIRIEDSPIVDKYYRNKLLATFNVKMSMTSSWNTGTMAYGAIALKTLIL